jgi:hypothetical protein
VVGECRANCDSGDCPNGQRAVFASASVNGKDEVMNLGILTVKNY